MKKRQVKKRNHVMPACLIRQWVVKNNGLNGVNVYQTPKEKFSFSSADGKSPFSFAIKDFIYVPKINDIRVNALEDWFSNVEGTLDLFVKQVISEAPNQPILKDRQVWTKLLLALFSLKNRTRYDLEKQKELLLKEPEMIDKIGIPNTKEIEIIILQNLINATTEESIDYGNCDMIFCKNPKGDLILSDRPFLHDAFDGFSFVTISPHYFVSLKKTSGIPSYTYHIADETFINMYNQKIAEHSRDWIVAREKSTLERYISLLKTNDEKDTPVFSETKYLNHGYEITPILL